MKLIFLVICFQIVCGAVYKSPNKDDAKYWRDYGETQLKEILFSQGIDRVKPARNVLYFVGDGMSFTTITAGRILKGQRNNRSGEETEFIFEKFPHFGLSKTYNINSQVSDSAGTATALFTGVKTQIAGICLNPAENTNFERLTTIIDWAQAEKKRTGIVTNTR
jgi:alkaline phosphatase